MPPNYRIYVINAFALAACGLGPAHQAPVGEVAGTLLAPPVPGRSVLAIVADSPAAGLVSNNSAGLVSNNSAGLRRSLALAGAQTPIPVVGALVVVTDGRGNLVRGATAALTGGNGAFTLRNVPIGHPVLVSATYTVARLSQVEQALMAPAAGRTEVVVDPAASVAAAIALQAASGDLDAIDLGRVDAATRALRERPGAISPADLQSPAALAAAFEREAATDPRLDGSAKAAPTPQPHTAQRSPTPGPASTPPGPEPAIPSPDATASSPTPGPSGTPECSQGSLFVPEGTVSSWLPDMEKACGKGSAGKDS